MTVLRNTAVVYQDSVNIDAFGRLRTSDTGQRLDVEFIYDKQAEVMDEVIVGAGTVVHQANSRDLILKTNSTTNSDKAEMLSHPVPYTPGNSQLVAITGTINEAGIAGGNAEVFFRSTVSGVLVETVVDQDSWNVDTMSDVDWETSQILEIDFQSLKVGRLRFALNRCGVIKPFHTIENDNIRNTGYWQLPSLPLCWVIYNDATYTYCEMGYGNSANGIGIRYKVPVNASAELRAICGTVKSEGGLPLFKIPGYNRSANMGTTDANVGNTMIPIISIRPKSSFNSLTNMSLAIPLEVVIETDNPIQVIAVHNCSLTGASWSDVDANESALEYDTSATAYSNGHVIFTDYVGTRRNVPVSNGGPLGKSILWDRKGTETGIFTICAVRTTGTTADVLAAINFKEIR